MQQALIYCRVSTEEQAKNNNSLRTQEILCRRFAESSGHKVVAVYVDDGKSATNLNRPALQDLIARCQQDKSVDAVIVQETDRLARNTNDHLTVKAVLKRAGVKLISANQPMLDESPEGNMIDTIIASVNQFQSEITGRKTKKGMQTKFDMGEYPGWAPIGYLNKRVNENGIVQDIQRRSVENGEYFSRKNKTKGIIVKDPEKWDLVKEGLKMYLTGNYSGLEISDILHSKGLRSKTGKRIHNSVILRMLKDPFYCGILRWNGQERKGNQEPMITEDEHRQIINIMDTHNLHCGRRRVHNFLLRGFVFCDLCGDRYTAEKHRIGKCTDYYHCGTKSTRHNNQGQNVAVAELEKQVENRFKTLKFGETFIKLIILKIKTFYEKQKEDQNRRIRVLLNKKMRIRNDRETAERKLIASVLEDEDYSRIRTRLREEESAIDSRINELNEEEETDFETIREVLMLANDIYGAYKKAPYELKRLYLSIFWEGFWVKDRKIVRSEPSKIIKFMQDEREIILRSDWCPSPNLIILFEDRGYIAGLKEKLKEIKHLASGC